MKEDSSQQRTDCEQECPPELTAGYDSYRGVNDPNVIIFVPKDAVPPFRSKVGGWELLQTSIDLDSAAKARIAEEGFFIERPSSETSSDIIPSDHDRPRSPSLEVEFALVIAGTIDSVRDRPKDIRQIVYDLARYKLQDQLLLAKSAEAERMQLALEGAIRGVEAFAQKQVYVPAAQSQPNDPGIPSMDRTLFSPPESISRAGLSSLSVPASQIGQHTPLNAEPNAGGVPHKNSPWPLLRRITAAIIVLVAIVFVIQQRAGLLPFAPDLTNFQWKTSNELQVGPPGPQ